MSRRIRVRVDSEVRVVSVALRRDEVEALDEYAKAAGVTRNAYLRAILRGVRPNPIGALWKQLEQDPGALPMRQRRRQPSVSTG